MTPSLTDYLRGLRRLWWIPILSLLIGGAIGVFAATAKPTVTSTGRVLFTFKPVSDGQNTACPSGGSQTDVGTARLNAYIQVIANSQPIRDLMARQGINTPPAIAMGDPGQVAITTLPGGIVGITVSTTHLTENASIALAKSLENEVANSILKTDSSQSAPILNANTVMTDPRAVTASPSMLKLGLPIALMLVIGLAAVYGITWMQGRIWTGREIEDRLEARLIGEVGDHAADGVALALALTKDRETSTRALLIPIGASAEGAVSTLGQLITDSWSEMKHPATLSTAAEVAVQPTAGTSDASDLLSVVVAEGGLDAHALQAATSADLIALVIGYGESRYQDLTSAGRMLSRVADAEIAVIGLAKRHQ